VTAVTEFKISENYNLVCNAVYFGRQMPTFLRKLSYLISIQKASEGPEGNRNEPSAPSSPPSSDIYSNFFFPSSTLNIDIQFPSEYLVPECITNKCIFYHRTHAVIRYLFTAAGFLPGGSGR
jgi:hypothetical protein